MAMTEKGRKFSQ